MHTLICGQTESGKSTLAAYFARSYVAAGRPVLILDPIGVGWPSGRGVLWTADPDYFSYQAKRCRGALLVVDEAGEAVGTFQRQMQWVTTRSRHLGHSALLVAQRPPMVAPNVRNQCRRLYLFTLAPEDAKVCAVEWNAPVLRESPRLEQHFFLSVDRYGDAGLWESRPAGAPVRVDTLPRMGL